MARMGTRVAALAQRMATTHSPRARLLVVDDNRDAAATLAMLLELAGYDVETCDDGVCALHRAGEVRFDAFVLDLGLPGLDGYELARALRSAACSRNAVIVAVSGYGSPEDRRRSAAAGFDAHFVKPVEAAMLANHLEAAFRRGESAVSTT